MKNRRRDKEEQDQFIHQCMDKANDIFTKMEEKRIMRNKWMSRKFWMSAAAFLGSIGTAIVGLSLQNEKITMIGIAASVLSQAIYAACEAYVDAAKKEPEK